MSAIDFRSSRKEAAPPASIDAEQALLGALLYDESAMARAQALRPEHFFDPLHARLFAAAAELITDKGRADPIVLAERFAEDASFQELGGIQYLADLIEKAPPAANASEYVEVIHETWARRQLIDLASAAQHAVVNRDRPASSILAEIRAKVEALESEAAPDDANLVSVADATDATIERLEREQATGKVRGKMTGLRCFDRRLGGLKPGWLIVVGARPSMGKAQPLRSRVLLRDGTWRRMGDLRLGDELASVDGAPSRVAGIFPQGEKQIYRLTFSDGRSARACGEHLWAVSGSRLGERVVTTDQLRELLGKERYRRRISIPLASGHFGEDRSLPIEPWLLGALIGNGCMVDGHMSFSTADAATLYKVQAAVGHDCVVPAGDYDYRLNCGGELRGALRSLGLYGKAAAEKFIPPAYLAATRESRLQLLRGLLDTDGWVEAFGVIRFSTASERLAHDVAALVRSLGGLCSISTKAPAYTHKGERRPGQTAYVCNIRHPDRASLLTLRRKQRRCESDQRWRNPTLVSVEPDGIEPAQCIRVTHQSSLYITDDYIVTHNTALLRCALYGAAEHNPDDLFALFSIEMDREEIVERALSDATFMAGEGIPFQDITNGKVSPIDLMRLKQYHASRVKPKNLYIDDRSTLSLDDVRRRIWALKRKGPVAAVGIDYLQLMETPPQRNGENGAALLGRLTAGLKRLARESQTCIILLSQLSRQAENREDKRPQLHDLRDSGSIEQDANAVLMLYREIYYLERNEPPEADVAKRQEWEIRCADVRNRLEVIAPKVRHGAVGVDRERYFAEFDHIEDERPLP